MHNVYSTQHNYTVPENAIEYRYILFILFVLYRLRKIRVRTTTTTVLTSA